jgi:hypothetical protein
LTTTDYPLYFISSSFIFTGSLILALTNTSNSPSLNGALFAFLNLSIDLSFSVPISFILSSNISVISVRTSSISLIFLSSSFFLSFSNCSSKISFVFSIFSNFTAPAKIWSRKALFVLKTLFQFSSTAKSYLLVSLRSRACWALFCVWWYLT